MKTFTQETCFDDYKQSIPILIFWRNVLVRKVQGRVKVAFFLEKYNVYNTFGNYTNPMFFIDCEGTTLT